MTISQVTLSARKITRGLTGTAVLLVLASIAGQLVKFLTGHDQVYGFVRLFNLDEEGNIPTYFSATILLCAALLLALITSLKRAASEAYSSEWAILSGTFSFLAIDEAAQIHEMLIIPMRGLLGQHAHGVFYYAWVIPGIAFASVFGLFYVKFLLHLPAGTRVRVVVAAMLFVGGAVGMEMLGSHYAELHGKEHLAYSMLATVEESLEMAGVIVFIDALLRYLADHYHEVRLRIHNGESSSLSVRVEV